MGVASGMEGRVRICACNLTRHCMADSNPGRTAITFSKHPDVHICLMTCHHPRSELLLRKRPTVACAMLRRWARRPGACIQLRLRQCWRGHVAMRSSVCCHEPRKGRSGMLEMLTLEAATRVSPPPERRHCIEAFSIACVQPLIAATTNTGSNLVVSLWALSAPMNQGTTNVDGDLTELVCFCPTA